MCLSKDIRSSEFSLVLVCFTFTLEHKEVSFILFASKFYPEQISNVSLVADRNFLPRNTNLVKVECYFPGKYIFYHHTFCNSHANWKYENISKDGTQIQSKQMFLTLRSAEAYKLPYTF